MILHEYHRNQKSYKVLSTNLGAYYTLNKLDTLIITMLLLLTTMMIMIMMMKRISPAMSRECG